MADAVADAALGAPAHCIVEVAGPERVRLVGVVQCYRNAKQGGRKVIADARALL